MEAWLVQAVTQIGATAVAVWVLKMFVAGDLVSLKTHERELSAREKQLAAREAEIAAQDAKLETALKALGAAVTVAEQFVELRRQTGGTG